MMMQVLVQVSRQILREHHPETEETINYSFQRGLLITSLPVITMAIAIH